jgi:parvulin-like peptidyl-prolyl isomerase
MKQLRVFSVLAVSLLAVLAVAACGGGSQSVPKDAVAVVDGQAISRADYDALWERTKANYKAQKRDIPKAGSAQFTSLKSSIVEYLVQKAEFEQKAKELGIQVTDKDVDAELARIKKQFLGNSDKKLQEQLKQAHLTLQGLRGDIRAKLIQDKLYAKVTQGVTVTDKEIRDYYDKHKDQYSTAESRTVRHILVDKKARADALYAQLKAGASFAQLAKKYSKDPGSAAQGGKLTVSKGQTVPEFDKLAFSLKKGELAAPVKTQYGWHIIQALSDVKPASVTPFAKAKDQIKAELLQTKKSQAMTKWVADVKKEFGDKTSYQVGFAPATSTTAASTTK